MPNSTPIRGLRKDEERRRRTKPGLAAVATASLLLLAGRTTATPNEGESASVRGPTPTTDVK